MHVYERGQHKSSMRNTIANDLARLPPRQAVSIDDPFMHVRNCHGAAAKDSHTRRI